MRVFAGSEIFVALFLLVLLAPVATSSTTSVLYPTNATGTNLVFTITFWGINYTFSYGTSNVTNITNLDNSYASIQTYNNYVNASEFPVADGTINNVSINIKYHVGNILDPPFNFTFIDDQLVISYNIYNGSINGTSYYSVVPTNTNDKNVSLAITNDRNWMWQDLGNMTVKVQNKATGLPDGGIIYLDAVWLDVSYDRAPNIVIMSPSSNAVWSGIRNITWNATDKDNDNLNVSIFYSTDNSSWQPITINTSNVGFYSWNTFKVNDGSNYTIKINVSDGQLANNSYSPVFSIDNSPPLAAINSPSNDKYVKGIITINSTVTDTGSGVDKVFFNISNTTWFSFNSMTLSSGFYIGTFDTSSTKDGNYNLTIFANDSVNNVNSSQNVTITIDNTKPILYNFYINPKITTSGNYVNISFSIDDSNLNISSVFSDIHYINNTLVKMLQPSNFSNVFKATLNTSGIQAEKYLFDFYASDLAGNSVWGNNSLLLALNQNAAGTFLNNSISIPQSILTHISVPSLNSSVDLSVSSNVSNVFLSAVSYNSSLVSLPAVPLGKYLDISVDDKIKSALSYGLIKISYDINAINSLGLDESSLRIYYLNESSNTWHVYDGPLVGGVNTSGKYVWANSTHFSFFGIGGAKLSVQSTNAQPVISNQFSPATLSLDGNDNSISVIAGQNNKEYFNVSSNKNVLGATFSITGIPSSWASYDSNLGEIDSNSNKMFNVYFNVPITEAGKEFTLIISISSDQSYTATKAVNLKVISGQTKEPSTIAAPSAPSTSTPTPPTSSSPLTGTIASLLSGKTSMNIITVVVMIELSAMWIFWYRSYIKGKAK